MLPLFDQWEQKERAVIVVREEDATMTETSSESRRRLRQGRSGVDGGVKPTNLCKWTSKFATILFLLTLVSMAQSLPVDGNAMGSDRVGTHRDSNQQLTNLQPNQYQLVQQGQLYLPKLLQQDPEFMASSTSDSDYPINSQNEDDSIGRDWETVIDPHVYVLNEWASSRPTSTIQQRKKRNAGPSLSIVNPLDVLRQRLLLEIARRRMIKSQNQIMANAEILKNIGRRR